MRATGWFEGTGWELDVWFDHMTEEGGSLEFIEMVLQTLFSNPHPYLDSLYTAVSFGKGRVVCHKTKGK